MQEGVATGAAVSDAAPDPQDDLLPADGPRRGRAPIRLSLRRLRESARLLTAVGAGMLVVVLLVCAVPLYVSLGSDVQLQAALAARPPADVNVEVTVSSPAVSDSAAAQVDGAIARIVPHELPTFAPTSARYLDTANLTFGSINGVNAFKADPALQPDLTPGRPQAFGFDLAQAAPHMRLIAGRLPADPAPAAASPPEALATPQSGLKLGDVVTMPVLGASDQVATVTIVGLWLPKDPADPYWNGRTFLAAEASGTLSPPPIFPIVLSRAGFLAALAPLSPSPGMTLHYVYYTRPDLLTARTMQVAAGAISRFRLLLTSGIVGGDELGANQATSRVALLTGLDRLIAAVQQQFNVSTLPLYVVIIQVVGLALLFVGIMARLLVESQAGEIATLKSRGASPLQLLGAFTLQGVLPAAVALLVGPPLAVALTLLLVRAGVPAAAGLVARDFTPAFILQNATAPAALQPALLGALGALLTLAVAVWQAARLDVLAFRRAQGREARPAAWRRLNLDLLLVVLCAVGYLELGQFGGLDVRSTLGQSGRGGASALLLGSPLLLLLAGALLGLRLFPLAIHAVARLAMRLRGAAGPLAFAQLARGAGRFSALVLLLTLSLAIGLFALTFQSSLGRNAADRAAYQTGADLRVQLIGGLEGTGFLPPIALRFAHLPGTTASTSVIRTEGHLPPSQGFANVGVLGIDPATFASAAYWRPDYADQPLAALLAQMRAHAARDAAGSDAAPIWTLVSPNYAASQHLRPGDRFKLSFDVEGQQFLTFVVGTQVTAFPTMPDDGVGYIVAAQPDLLAGFSRLGLTSTINGPDEFWLRTGGTPADAATVANALANPNLFVTAVADRRALVQRYLGDPLSAGMTALLLAGAAIAALLAILGGIVQAVVSVRQRTVQFAVLRTLGTSRRQLARVVLIEQLALYAFGLLAGTLFGLVLASATLPYLQFSIGLTDTSGAGGPPYVLVVDPARTLALYAGLLLAFLLALLLQRLVLARLALGRLLRIGED